MKPWRWPTKGDPNVGQTIAASWNALVNDTPEDNIFPDNWLLNRLKNGDGFLPVDGGDIITATLEYAVNGTVTSYSDTETIPTQRQDVFDRAQYNWKEYAGTVVQSELENAINQGSAKKFDLLKAKLSNLKKSFDRVFDIDLHSDGTTTAASRSAALQALC
jgi:molecular chaperone DnaK (HSP70)